MENSLASLQVDSFSRRAADSTPRVFDYQEHSLALLRHGAGRRRPTHPPTAALAGQGTCTVAAPAKGRCRI